MGVQSELLQTIIDMVDDTRGILAMDESMPTMEKRFAPIGVESTEANRRAYRSLLLSTPGLGEYISGVILFEETLYQKSDDGRLCAFATRYRGQCRDAGPLCGDLSGRGYRPYRRTRGTHGWQS